MPCTTVFAGGARPSNRPTLFPGPTPLTIPNNSLVGLAVFAWSIYHILCSTLRRPISAKKNAFLSWVGGRELDPIQHIVSWIHPTHAAPQTATRSSQPFFREFVLVTNGLTELRRCQQATYAACATLPKTLSVFSRTRPPQIYGPYILKSNFFSPYFAGQPT